MNDFGLKVYSVFDKYGEFIMKVKAETPHEAIEKARDYGYWEAFAAKCFEASK
jgi:hypothetical protein